MNQGNTYTLKTLLDQVDTIEIPIIQRDYVQGRDSDAAYQVRQQFVQALLNQLSRPLDQGIEPLDLDFIYGSVSKSNVFCPLDGQQRLTTLFLLHWYLANYDQKFDDFKLLMDKDGQSRFSYQTRKSSRIFFNQLTHTELDVGNFHHDNQSVSRALRNQKWFFVTLGYDPTVQSALNMLDTIHSTLSAMPPSKTHGLYDRLMCQTSPYITFQFLNLNEFNLSDDLYIKMNGRGKPLTAFENFKAKFEQTVATLCRTDTHKTGANLTSYVSQKMDGQWIDMFWEFSGGNTQKLDNQQIQFFKEIISALYPLSDTDKSADQIRGVLDKIRGTAFQPTHYNYEQQGCFSSSLIVNFVKLMDQICDDQGRFKSYLEENFYYNEREQFEAVITPPTLIYSDALQFFAWCLFLITHDDIQSEALFEWMRVVHNLVHNTRFNDSVTYTSALLSLRNLVTHAEHLLQHFAEATEVLTIQGFDRSQIREEQIKAQLIERSEDWKRLIRRAEAHPYFKGQIEFLLDFSGILDFFDTGKKCNWSDAQDQEIMGCFEDYLKKSEALFNGDGLASRRDKKFERALLTKGDYLLASKRNFSFLKNSDRDISWKRLLRGSSFEMTYQDDISKKRRYIKDLMDDIALTELNNIDDALQRIIDQPSAVEGWRHYAISHPEIVTYCTDSFIRHHYNFQHTLLLKFSQTNGAHLELRTLHLYLSAFKGRLTEELAPFCHVHTKETYSVDTVPSLQFYKLNTQNAHLQQYNIFLSVEFYRDQSRDSTPQFWAKLCCNEGQLPEQLIDAVDQYPEYKDDLTNPSQGIKLSLDNPIADIDQLLSRLAQIITQLECVADSAEASHE